MWYCHTFIYIIMRYARNMVQNGFELHYYIHIADIRTLWSNKKHINFASKFNSTISWISFTIQTNKQKTRSHRTIPKPNSNIKLNIPKNNQKYVHHVRPMNLKVVNVKKITKKKNEKKNREPNVLFLQTTTTNCIWRQSRALSAASTICQWCVC